MFCGSPCKGGWPSHLHCNDDARRIGGVRNTATHHPILLMEDYLITKRKKFCFTWPRRKEKGFKDDSYLRAGISDLLCTLSYQLSTRFLCQNQEDWKRMRPEGDLSVPRCSFVPCQLELLCGPSHLLLYYRWVQETPFQAGFARQHSAPQPQLHKEALQRCAQEGHHGLLVLAFHKWLPGLQMFTVFWGLANLLFPTSSISSLEAIWFEAISLPWISFNHGALLQG